MRRRPVIALVTATLCAPLVASCGAGSVSVYMALDADGARKRSTFYTDTETIVCIAEVPSPREGITVSALIRQIRTDKNVDYILGIGEQVPQKQGAGTSVPKVAFALTKSAGGDSAQLADAPWPAGSFQCEISVNGTLKGIAPFDIQMPKCPLYPAATGISCAGFYPAGARCPAVDQTIQCTCLEQGVWQCDG